jgi:iron-sulfur cluster biosynthesis transcriptional regulator SufR
MEALTERQMQETRRRILQLLKLKGEMTADELSQALKITSMGVRRHLTMLERDGLIRYETAQRGMGRPSYLYSLTPLGDERFPRTYAQLANSLLEAIQALQGEVGIERIFEKRTEWLESQYRARLAGKDLEGRVAELARIRTEEGYMADWEKRDVDTYLLYEHNCAICQVASRCSSACSYELELFRRVLADAKVDRETHIIKGDRMCTYVIRRKSARRAGTKKKSLALAKRAP